MEEIGTIKIVKCSCPPDHCDKGVEPPNDCIQRLDGTVETAQCPICNAHTWHHDGACIRCRRLLRDQGAALRDSSKVEQSPVKREVAGSIPAPAAISLTIKLGDGSFIVTDKRRVAKILKTLLETDES